MPAFAFRHIKDLYSVFWDKSRELAEALSTTIKEPSTSGEKPSSIVDIRDWSSRATLDIIGVAGLGQDFNSLEDPNNELAVTYKNIFNADRRAQLMQLLAEFVPLWFLRALPVKRNEQIADAIRTIKKVARQTIQAKRQKIEKGEPTGVDIISVALESGGFSDEDLVNQLMTFLVSSCPNVQYSDH